MPWRPWSDGLPPDTRKIEVRPFAASDAAADCHALVANALFCRSPRCLDVSMA
jgi:hypothetical protein